MKYKRNCQAFSSQSVLARIWSLLREGEMLNITRLILKVNMKARLTERCRTVNSLFINS